MTEKDPFKTIENFSEQMKGALQGLERVIRGNDEVRDKMPEHLKPLHDKGIRKMFECVNAQNIDLAKAFTEMQKFSIRADKLKND